MLQMAQNVVNLRQFRKRRARQEADEAAQANRIRHGTGKKERQANQARQELEAARLDGHFLGNEVPNLPEPAPAPARTPPRKS